ncbi:MAG: 2,4-dihydroxyhept-2-ene-1,7-dioic acid aldolase [Desulfamplus sp.]|nr:2,4-dihydroxyhept-2-ene-1,7-dioic acid aldolase [Desulfamplus sp.]
MNNSLKNKLKNKQTTLGSWITLGNTGIAEIMANAGFDWLVVDLEHSVISIETAGELIRTIDLAGSTPLVRLTSNNPDQIKRVMDAGAYGIIVPMVNTQNDAEKAVEAVHYGPRGNRGVGLARAQKYGVGFKEYLQWEAGSPVVIVQIEHKEALGNLEEILSVPGVDGFIIGPYDLSCSLGMPGDFDNNEFIKAMEHIKKIGQELDVPGGLHIVEPDTSILAKTLEDGYRFIAFSLDIRILDVGLRQGMNCFKEVCK